MTAACEGAPRMRGVVLHSPGDVRSMERVDPRLIGPTRGHQRGRCLRIGPVPDRGIDQVIGHEYVCVVEEIGKEFGAW